MPRAHPPTVLFKTFTPKTLEPFHGKEGGRILLAINGIVFDLTAGRNFYGPVNYLESLDVGAAAFCAEIEKDVVGPVSGAVFNEFLLKVVNEDSPSQEIGDLIGKLKDVTSESSMYKPLVDAFASQCPQLVFNDEHNLSVKYHDYEIQPDITIRDKKTNDTVAYVQVKVSPYNDPFDDNNPGHIGDSVAARNTLGQITRYATAHQGLSFQTHVFSVLIFPPYLRFMRWDRAGVIYTKRLRFSEPDIAIFLRRPSGASREYRGCDVSVKSVSPEDGDLVSIRNTLGLKEDAELCKISIDENLYFLAKNQAHGSISPIGRSTRCFKAYSKTTKGLVLLKDTWRLMSPHLIPEDEIYKKLQAAQVFNLPQVYDGANVLSKNPWQETKTASMAE
ncbi:hypothetical protein C0991_010102, partial [Blastosporella zonata]